MFNFGGNIDLEQLKDFNNINQNKKIKKFKSGFFYEADTDLFVDLKNFISNFNTEEVIQSIFIINSWLPNKSSIFKAYILNHILLNLVEEESKLNLRIDTYKKFKFFTKKIKQYMPTFYDEDYIPEGDGNEIKYYYNHKSYSVFYGGNYSNLYEYYYLFEIMFISSKRLFSEEMDPHTNFIEILNYIENIINITSNHNNKKDFEIGYFEIPSYEYYLNICKKFKYISNSISRKILNLNELERVEKCKNIDEIRNSFDDGEPLPMVIEYKNNKFPLFSRDPIVKLVNVYNKKTSNLNQYEFYKNIKLGIYKFINIRFNKESLMLLYY